MNKTIGLVLILAILSGLLALVVLILPLGNAGSELSNRATVSSAVSTTFALISGVIAILVTARVSSTDYQAEQNVKADTAKLLASLRSIMLKGALFSQKAAKTNAAPDFTNELKSINEFLSSTTAFAFWSWEGYKSALAEERPESWRLFFMYLAELLDSKDNFRNMISRAVEIETLLTSLTKKDIRRISQYTSDLAKAVGKFQESRTNSLLINAVASVYEKRGDANATLQMFLHLKKKGVEDPNIDMFIAVMSPEDPENTKKLQAALEAGADPSVTDSELIQKYQTQLKDFIREQ
jgi:hypothetical protein